MCLVRSLSFSSTLAYVSEALTEYDRKLNVGLVHILRTPLSRTHSRLEETFRRIRKHSSEFDDERSLAHETAAASDRDAAARHRDKVEASLPNVVIWPKTPDSIFSVPFHRNKNFTSRSPMLMEMRSKLEDALGSQASCVLHGPGGVGKTQLALEYCYMYRLAYPFIFWIRAQDTTSLAESFSSVAQQLGLVQLDSKDQRNAAEAAKSWLMSSKK